LARFTILKAVGICLAVGAGFTTGVVAQVPALPPALPPPALSAPSAAGAAAAAAQAAQGAADSAATDDSQAAAKPRAHGKHVAKKSAAKKSAAKKPRKAAAKAPAEKQAGKGQVLVVNQRAARLRQLTLVSPVGGVKPAVVARDLASGAKAIGKLPAKGGCDYALSGEFDDGTTIEADSVSVCEDRTLNLTE